MNKFQKQKVCNWYDTDCHLEYDGFTSVDKDKSIIQQLLEYVKGDSEVKSIDNYRIIDNEGLINYTDTNNKPKFVDFYEMLEKSK